MKKSILLFILLNSSMLCLAQSKIETSEWIIGKFNKWKVVDSRINKEYGAVGRGTMETPLSLSIVNCNFVFKSKLSYVLGGQNSTDKAYSFNFGDVETIEWINVYGTELLIIITKGRLVKETSFSKNEYNLNSNQGTSSPSIRYIDRCIIGFDTYGEDDFKARMIKALHHLQTFCSPTPKPKEVF